MKRENPSLWNGLAGGTLRKIESKNDTTILAFKREKDNNTLIVIANLSPNAVSAELHDKTIKGDYVDYFSGEEFTFTRKSSIKLAPWQYYIYQKK